MIDCCRCCLSSLALFVVLQVKPETARAVEDHLIRLARSGKVSAKVRCRCSRGGNHARACPAYLPSPSLRRRRRRRPATLPAPEPALLQITEDNVIKILEDLESQTKAAAGVKKVTITRRKRDDEDDDDDDDDF